MGLGGFAGQRAVAACDPRASRRDLSDRFRRRFLARHGRMVVRRPGRSEQLAHHAHPRIFAGTLRPLHPDQSEGPRAVDECRRTAAARGEQLPQNERELVKFSVSRVFGTPELAKRTILLLLLSLTTLIGWWGISTWVPQYAAGVAAKAGIADPRGFATTTALLYNVGAIIGYAGFGFVADAIGRKLTMWIYFLASLIINPVLFLWTKDPTMVVIVATINGIFTLGQFSWMAVYVPELYPTAVRATAASVVFNLARYLVAITTFYAGVLAVRLGGIAEAATVIGFVYILGLVVTPFVGRETKGEPLPA